MGTFACQSERRIQDAPRAAPRVEKLLEEARGEPKQISTTRISNRDFSHKHGFEDPQQTA